MIKRPHPTGENAISIISRLFARPCPKILLHIGAGKCGSSALQRYLSANPILPLKSGGRLIYSAIDKTGNILVGAMIRQRAQFSITGYVNSATLGELSRTDVQFHLPFARDNDLIVLSCEAWRAEPERLESQDILSIFGSVDAIMYVRPPIQYINSAYWQWGAWEGQDISDFVDSRLSHACWEKSAARWDADKRVEKLTVRSLPSDIVSDFLEYADVETTQLPEAPGGNFNKSLPNSILRVMQRHPYLRRNSHDSEIDFVIEKYLSDHSGRPDWVLTPELCEHILTVTSPYNNALMERLTEEQAERIKSDNRWWEVEKDVEVRPATPLPAADPQTDSLLASSIAQIFRMERERLERKAATLLRPSAF